jgi:hypothetical protein
MQDLPFLLAIAGLTVMGVGAVIDPTVVMARSGILEPTPAGRKERCHPPIRLEGLTASPQGPDHITKKRRSTRERLHQPRGHP